MDAFIFKSARYDQSLNQIELCYAYQNGLAFTEVLHFPNAKSVLSDAEKTALDKAIRQLHLAAGISYYKAYCPKNIIIENMSLSQPEADFFYKFYLLGLGEFAVTNCLDLKDVLSFPVHSKKAPVASDLRLPKTSVVPIGGGKDSIVSHKILRRKDHPFRMIAINAGKPIKDVMSVSGSPDPILITRKLDPALFTLNDQGAMNGHVPITGILSFIMACGSILYGYDSIVMSNEGSASEGNMEYGGIEINHQYSKSLEFELDFNSYIKECALANLNYFSILRPLSETGIACLFSTCNAYFDHFKSCNRNFHIDEGVRKYGWCCQCPKCHFVFLALSPFIEKQQLIRIFGSNILNDGQQEDGFRELLGLKGHKPFECVGEIDECRDIMASLSIREEWKNDLLVESLSKEIINPPLKLTDLKNEALKLKYDHHIPADYLEMLNEFIRSCR